MRSSRWKHHLKYTWPIAIERRYSKFFPRFDALRFCWPCKVSGSSLTCYLWKELVDETGEFSELFLYFPSLPLSISSSTYTWSFSIPTISVISKIRSLDIIKPLWRWSLHWGFPFYQFQSSLNVAASSFAWSHCHPVIWSGLPFHRHCIKCL